MPEYSEMLKNTSLVFFSSHAASEGPIRPNVPSAIEIGGIQIKDKPDPLPQNIAEFWAMLQMELFSSPWVLMSRESI